VVKWPLLSLSSESFSPFPFGSGPLLLAPSSSVLICYVAVFPFLLFRWEKCCLRHGCPWRVVTLSPFPASLTPPTTALFSDLSDSFFNQFQAGQLFLRARKRSTHYTKRKRRRMAEREREVHVKLETHKK